jgi:hypothetical protein
LIWYRTSAPSPLTNLAWTFQRQYIPQPLPIAVGYRWFGGFTGGVPKTRRYQVIQPLPPATNSAITDSQIVSSFIESDSIEFGEMRPFLPPSGIIGPLAQPVSLPSMAASQTIPLGYNSYYTLASGIYVNQAITIVDNLGRAANGPLTVVGNFNTGSQILITAPYGGVSVSWSGAQWIVTSAPTTSYPINWPFYLSFGTSGSFLDEIPSEYDGNYLLLDVPLPTQITLQQNFAGSSIPRCRVAPLTTVVLLVQWIPSGGSPIVIGTITFQPGQFTGTYSTNQVWVLPANDSVRIIATIGVDTTIAEIAGTITATRGL